LPPFEFMSEDGVWDVESDAPDSHAWDIEDPCESGDCFPEVGSPPKRLRHCDGGVDECVEVKGEENQTNSPSSPLGLEPPPPLKGTEWWAKIIWNCLAHERRQRPAGLTMVFTHEDMCAGSAGICFGFKVAFG
jgi:hypothetical protein